MRDPFDVCPGDDVSGHAKRDLGQEVGMKLALAVYRYHIRVLHLKHNTKYRTCGLHDCCCEIKNNNSNEDSLK